MTKRFELRKVALGTALVLLSVVLVRCDGEQPTKPKSRTGSIALDVDVPETGTSAQGAAKAVISRGDLRITGDNLDAEIFRSIPVQGGRLQTLVNDIPVGEVAVDLDLLESDDAVVWKGSTLVTVVANQETPASLVLQRVGDQAPEGNFTVSPENGKVGADFQFQAEVSDRHDATDKLEVRWDFDNDGSFDTGWDTNKQAGFRYAQAGQFIVNLEVRDGSGNVNNFSKQVAVELEVGTVVVDIPVVSGGSQIARGELRISGDQLEAEIVRNVPLQGNRLQAQVDGVPVGQVDVELRVLEGDDAVLWEGNVRLTVDANADAIVQVDLQPVGDEPPAVGFSVNPETGSVNTQFRFVAEVLDRHDSVDKLEVRWDFDNDGNFETGWNTNKQAEYKFPESGNYRVALEAKDTGGKVNSITRVVNVENTAPIARAGQNITRNVGEMVQLDGSASGDPDGDALDFQWTQSSGPPVALDRPNSPDPTFVPQEPGAYSFALVVTDGKLESPADEVVVTVVGQVPTPDVNSRPIADAGPGRVGVVGGLVRLDGRGSTDPDGDPLTYEWVQIGGPLVELLGADSPLAEFTPGEAATYTFSLVVGDGKAKSQVSEVTVDITEPEQPVVNTPPVANAWAEGEKTVGEWVQLDGSGSWDEEGDPLDFIWTQTGGPQAELFDADREYPYFTPSVPGEYVFALVVSDGQDDSPPAEVQVRVIEPVNTPPVAEAYGPGEVMVGEEVYLEGGSSWDEEDDPLEFTWAQTGGPQVVLRDAQTAYPSFTPAVSGEYVFALVVSDGKDKSPAAEVRVRVHGPENNPPVADAQGPAQVGVGEVVVLDGSHSFDPDGDALTYEWVQTGGPPLGLVGYTATPSFTPQEPGEYVFALVVSDGELDSAPAEVVVQVVESGGGLPGPGPRIVFASTRDGSPALFLVNALGRNPQKLSNGDFDGDVEPEAAPDGVHIAFASYRDGIVDPFDGNLAAEIYVMDESGADLRRLTNNEFPDHEPSWSPDGRRIVFVSARNSQDYGYIKTDLYVMNADGSGQVQLSPDDGGLEAEPDFSPDGRKIAFTSYRELDAFGNLQGDIFAMNPDGSNWVNLTNDPSFDTGPDWSPNGRKIAFASNRNGVSEIFAMNPDGSGVVNLTRSPDSNDWNPAWGPDGLTIAFVSDRTGLQEIFLMGADGRNQRQLAEGFAHAAWPTWMRAFEALGKPVGW